MPDDGFGSELWKNLQSVKFGEDGGIEAPVRANGREGIVVGLDAVAESENSRAQDAPATAESSRRWWKRLLRR